VLLGRGAGYIWASISGKSWVQLAAVSLGTAAYTLPAATLIGWFLRQTSWESARENALYWLTYLPSLVAVWLALKFVCVVICVVRLRALRLASPPAIGSIIVGWLALTSVVAAILHLALPYSWSTPAWCFAAVAISTPLARVLVLPISLHYGRHQ
jgi:hypothetical protein